MNQYLKHKHEDVYQPTSSRGRGRGGKHRGRSHVKFRTGETVNRQDKSIGKYGNMKAKIQKMFGDPAPSEGSGGAPAVKSEPVFETKHEDVYQPTSSRGRGRGGKLEVDM